MELGTLLKAYGMNKCLTGAPVEALLRILGNKLQGLGDVLGALQQPHDPTSGGSILERERLRKYAGFEEGYKDPNSHYELEFVHPGLKLGIKIGVLTKMALKKSTNKMR